MREAVPALARLAAFVELTDAERRYLARVARPPRTFEAKAIIRQEGIDASHSYILLDGWVGSFTTSADGRRSMTKVHMTGDMMGHASLAFCEAAETLVALCPVTVVGLTSSAIGAVFQTHPRLAALLYVVAMEDRVRQMDWSSALLRLDAAGRIAALFLDLRDRQEQLKPIDGPIDCHLTQYDIADLTGLTAVHTNRVIQQFRRDAVIHYRGHQLTILNEDRLRLLADRPVRLLRRSPEWLTAIRH